MRKKEVKTKVEIVNMNNKVSNLSENSHFHPSNGMTNSTTHKHPNGKNQHSHNYSK